MDEESAEAEELAAYERERQERIRLRSQISWKITGWVMAAALALLGYDAAAAAIDAHADGRGWVYQALISTVCWLALLTLAAHRLRRPRR